MNSWLHVYCTCILKINKLALGLSNLISLLILCIQSCYSVAGEFGCACMEGGYIYSMEI
jgi:hypothetical protein